MSGISTRLIRPRSPRMLIGTLALSLVVASLWLIVGLTPAGRAVEGMTLNNRAQNHHLKRPANVAVMAVDQDALAYSHQWPLPLATYSHLISALRNAGVAAIVIDLPFDRSPLNPQDAGTFADELEQGAKQGGAPVVFVQRAHKDRAGAKLGPAWTPYHLSADAKARLANLKHDAAAGGSSSGALEAPAGAITGGGDIKVTNTALAQGDQTVAGEQERNPLSLKSVLVGVSARERADGGRVRSYPVRGTWAGKQHASAALQALKAAGVSTKGLPDRITLNWYGTPGTIDYESAAGYVSGLGSPTNLHGRIVVVGVTQGAVLDNVATAEPGRMPSAELQATAIANLLDRSYLHQPPSWVGETIALALVLFVWALMLCTPLLLSVTLSIAAAVGYFLLVDAAYTNGVVLPMVTPLVAAFTVFTTLALVLSAAALRERLRIRGLFARYVPADVVRELVDTDDPIRLGGEAREVTVLFSDIRGFTSLSEHVDPEEMVEQLNEYFAAMVDVVGRNNGTLDKFLGDGLMAIFGAPTGGADHAADACTCALEMLEELEEVNDQRRERNLSPLHIGIGVHTGLAVVGNVGSPLFRVDFTAIGDTVNLASRLEGTTKDLGAEIVISSTTAVAARAAGLAVAPLGNVVVKGRDGVTEVFALVPDAPVGAAPSGAAAAG